MMFKRRDVLSGFFPVPVQSREHECIETAYEYKVDRHVWDSRRRIN
jgi:hypothetical protein